MDKVATLKFAPEERLVFDVSSKHGSQAFLQISNKDDTDSVVYKIKTTTPERYLVKPNHGLINPSSEAQITIIVVQSKKKEEKASTRHDKFLVQAIVIDKKTKSEINEKRSQEFAEAVTQIFNKTEKKLIFSKKLLVDYAAPTAAQQERSPKENGFSPKTKQFGSAQTPVLSGPMPGTPESMFAEIIAIRKKYDDLVAFTVSLTAERDALASELALLKNAKSTSPTPVHTRTQDQQQSSPTLQVQRDEEKSFSRSLWDSIRYFIFQFMPFVLIASLAFYTGRLLQIKGLNLV